MKNESYDVDKRLIDSQLQKLERDWLTRTLARYGIPQEKMNLASKNTPEWRHFLSDNFQIEITLDMAAESVRITQRVSDRIVTIGIWEKPEVAILSDNPNMYRVFVRYM